MKAEIEINIYFFWKISQSIEILYLLNVIFSLIFFKWFVHDLFFSHHTYIYSFIYENIAKNYLYIFFELFNLGAKLYLLLKTLVVTVFLLDDLMKLSYSIFGVF